MNKPIFALFTFSLIIAKGKLTIAAQPTPANAIHKYNIGTVFPNNTIHKYAILITNNAVECTVILPNFLVSGSNTNAGKKAPTAFNIKKEYPITFPI